MKRAWEEDAAREIGTAVPLSRTMAERVRKLREWARGRAVPAA